MYPIDLKGKKGVILGVANDRSIAWSIARVLDQAGARLALTYQGGRLQERVTRLADTLEDAMVLPCDATDDDQIEALFQTVKQEFGDISFLVHSIAYANRDDLKGEFSKTARDSFLMSIDISAYSLIPIARYATPLMEESGSIVAMTFQASERVFPGYNVMGTAKAALENEVTQLAYDLGPDKIRVNAVSPGPLDTVSSRVIKGYRTMKRAHEERSPMKRNITSEEVAKTALFLCSDLSSGITGEVVHVDTGYNIMGI